MSGVSQFGMLLFFYPAHPSIHSSNYFCRSGSKLRNKTEYLSICGVVSNEARSFSGHERREEALLWRRGGVRRRFQLWAGGTAQALSARAGQPRHHGTPAPAVRPRSNQFPEHNSSSKPHDRESHSNAAQSQNT